MDMSAFLLILDSELLKTNNMLETVVNQPAISTPLITRISVRLDVLGEIN